MMNQNLMGVTIYLSLLCLILLIHNVAVNKHRKEINNKMARLKRK